jgi:hypothetical protein
MALSLGSLVSSIISGKRVATVDKLALKESRDGMFPSYHFILGISLLTGIFRGSRAYYHMVIKIAPSKLADCQAQEISGDFGHPLFLIRGFNRLRIDPPEAKGYNTLL